MPSFVANPKTPARLIAERDQFHQQVKMVRGKTGQYLVQFKGGDRRFSKRDEAERAMAEAIRRGDKPMLFLTVRLPGSPRLGKGGECIWTYPSLLNTEGKMPVKNPVLPRVGDRVVVRYGFTVETKTGKFKYRVKPGMTGAITKFLSSIGVHGEWLARVRLDSGVTTDLDWTQVELLRSNPRRNIFFAEAKPKRKRRAESPPGLPKEGFKIFERKSDAMLATDTYDTGVNMPPFQYVEAYGRKGRFALIAFGAYNAMGLIGPEQGGVALVDEVAKRVVGTVTIPYSRKKRFLMWKQVYQEVNWPWGAKNAGFGMRYMPNPCADPVAGAYKATDRRSVGGGGSGRGMKKCPQCGGFVTSTGVCFKCQHPEMKRPTKNPGPAYHSEHQRLYAERMRRSWKHGDPVKTAYYEGMAHAEGLALSSMREKQYPGEAALNPGRPTSAFMRRCMAGVGPGYDPGAVCAGTWHKMSAAQKKKWLAKENPGRAYHQREARRYAKLFAGDVKAGHRDAAEYWQGALSAEAASVAAGGVVRNPLKWFHVYIGNKLIDAIPVGGKPMTAEQVRRSLVQHDGYDHRIRVVATRARVRPNWTGKHHAKYAKTLEEAALYLDKAGESSMSHTYDAMAYAHRRSAKPAPRSLSRNPKRRYQVEILKAAKYYGPHASGWVLLVNGHVYLHGDLTDCKRLAERVGAAGVKRNPLLMVVPNGGPAAQARPIVQEVLRMHGLSNKFRISKTSFSGFGYGDGYFVTIEGWKPNRELTLRVRVFIEEKLSVVKLPDPQDQWVVEFKGPGIAGNPLPFKVAWKLDGRWNSNHFQSLREAESFLARVKKWPGSSRHQLVDERTKAVLIMANPLLMVVPNPRKGRILDFAPESRTLSIPEWHQLRIALSTLKMTPAMAGVMGGMSIPEAKAFLKRVGYSDAQISKLAQNPHKKAKKTKALTSIEKTKGKKPGMFSAVGIPMLAASALKGAIGAGAGIGIKAAAAATGITANPSKDMGTLMKNPRFAQAVKLYRKFHGCDPKSVKRVLIPIGDTKRIDGREVFVSLGKAPSEAYDPPGHSGKAGSIYVHPYERKPEKVVSADGKTIVTLPGSHRVTDWIRG